MWFWKCFLECNGVLIYNALHYFFGEVFWGLVSVCVLDLLKSA